MLVLTMNHRPIIRLNRKTLDQSLGLDGVVDDR
jgi:hypothetical protein